MSAKIGEPYPDFKGYEMPKTVHYAGEGVGLDLVPNQLCPMKSQMVSPEECGLCPLAMKPEFCKEV
jgi:hypothetical protein